MASLKNSQDLVFEIGDFVEKRDGNPYNNARRGTILELDETRAKVHWTEDQFGNEENIRTWCALKFLKHAKPK